VQRRDDLCTFTHRGRDPLDRAAAYVANREDAGQIGFKRALEITSGTNETFVVECDAGAG
jgi:hypothetical protein